MSTRLLLVPIGIGADKKPRLTWRPQCPLFSTSLLVGALLCAFAFPLASNAQSFTVTTLTDDLAGVAGNCNQTQGGAAPSPNCSLRDAVAAVEALKSSTAPTINFASSLASASNPGTYTLGSGGTLLMYSGVNIAGPGPSALTISGAGKYQIFVFVSGTVSVSGLTLTKGSAGNGGAIQSYTDLTVTNCILSGNSASDGGGAIESQGPTLHVSNSIITGNSAQGSGGIDNTGNSSFTLDNSTVSNNTALDAGGIGSSGPLVVTNSVFSGNSATVDDGGAINNYGGTLSISGSFLLNNTAAARGGGIFTGNQTTAINTTVISGNSAPANHGSGINNLASTMTLTNDIIPDSIVGAYTGSVSSGPVPAAGVTLQGSAVSVARGSTSANTSTITITPAGGLTGTVTLKANVSSSPSGASNPPTVSFGSTSPLLLTGTAPGTATLTINTTAATTGSLGPILHRGVPWYASGGAALAFLIFCGYPARRRRSMNVTGMLILSGAFLCAVVACGGGSNGGGGGGGAGGGGSQGTTSGSYSILVTATSGTSSATCTVALTVQ